MEAREFFKFTLDRESRAVYRGQLALDPDDPFTVMFYTPYNKFSLPITENGRTFKEKILGRAFTKSLGKGLIACCYEHNPDRILGIEGQNMAIRESEDGLRCRVQLEPNTFNMAIIDSVSAGELACSVGFFVIKERWPQPDIRHIITADLHEISLCRNPVYPQTSSCFSRPPGQERRV
jgi:HK97 family phage prohead protease